MKVYAVISEDTWYDAGLEELLGIFSTEELAAEFIKTLPTEHATIFPHSTKSRIYYDIKEYTLDEKDS